MTSDDKEAGLNIGQRKEGILLSVSAQLEQEFLGLRKNADGHWPEREFSVVQDEELIKPGNENDLITKMKETNLWEKRQEIINAKIDSREAASIILLNRVLNQNPDLVDAMIEGLFDFQEKRMGELGVREAKIESNIKHERVVTELASHGGDQLTRLIASFHDVSKYYTEESSKTTVANPPDFVQEKLVMQKTALGLHETASACMAGDIMSTVLNTDVVRVKLLEGMRISESNWDDVVSANAKFAEIAVANHGHNEYPEENAKKDSNNTIDEANGIYRLFRDQVFFDNYRPVEVFSDSLDDDKLIELRRISEGLNEADFLSGSLLEEAFVKYHEEVSIYLLGNRSSYEYILSFVETFKSAYKNAPNEIGVRLSLEENKKQVAFMVTVLEAVDKGEDETNKLRKKLESSSMNVYKVDAIIRTAEYMKQLTQGYHGEPGLIKFSFPDWKMKHLDQFRQLVSQVKEQSGIYDDVIVQEMVNSKIDEFGI